MLNMLCYQHLVANPNMNDKNESLFVEATNEIINFSRC